MGMGTMGKGKHRNPATTIRIPRPMRKHLQEVLDEDGRKLGEYTRSLLSQAIADCRKRKAAAKTA